MASLSFVKLSSITKEEFLAAYNKHLPNAWTRFTYRYFSKSVQPKDKWVSMAFLLIVSILFALGFIGSVIGAKHTFVAAVTIPFAILLFSLGLLTLPAFIMNNIRIKKICKILNVSVYEYNILANRYLID